MPIFVWCSSASGNGRYFLAAWYVLSGAYSRGHDERGLSVIVRAPHPIEKPPYMVSS